MPQGRGPITPSTIIEPALSIETNTGAGEAILFPT